MVRKITRFARAGKCDGFGASGPAGTFATARCARLAKASQPKPQEKERKTSRRVKSGVIWWQEFESSYIARDQLR